MFAIMDEHYNGDTVTDSARQMLPIKIGALMNSVHDPVNHR